MTTLITGATGFVGWWVASTAKDSIIATRFALTGKPDRIIHCAWDHQHLDNNICMTAQVVRFAENTGAKLTYISSGVALYDTEHGEIKRICESMCAGHTILRLYSFIGPRLQQFAPYTFLNAASYGFDIIITGTGETVRSYMYAEDMARKIWEINEPGIFEIGSNVPVTIKELADMIAELFGVGVQVLGGDDGSRAVYLPEAGFTPRPLREQLLLTIGGL